MWLMPECFKVDLSRAQKQGWDHTERGLSNTLKRQPASLSEVLIKRASQIKGSEFTFISFGIV